MNIVSRKQKGKAPTADEINKAIETATEPEAAWYNYSSLKAILTAAKLVGQAAYDKALSVVLDSAKFRELAHAGGDSWSGKPPPTAFQNVQAGLAKVSAAELDPKTPIRVDFAINPEAKFIRGISGISDASKKDVDNMLLGWLANVGIVNSGGTLYKLDANEKDKIKKENNGKPALADPEATTKLFTDPQRGFAKYAQEANNALQVEVRPQSYTAQPQAAPAA